ncbi:MAG: hypothetical protein ABIA47_02520 [bacterium]
MGRTNTQALIRRLTNEHEVRKAARKREEARRRKEEVQALCRAEIGNLRLTEQEIMALPSKNREEVDEFDICIGEIRASSLGLMSQNNPGISWYNAYIRPSTGERFKVYDFDRP